MTSEPSTGNQHTGIMVLDLGTSGLRTSLYDLHGRRIDNIGSRHPWSLNTTSDGGATLDPETVFDNVVKGIDETLAECETSGWTVAHIASCVLCPTVVGLDKNDRPVTPIFTWADVRATRAAVELKTAVNPEETFQRTGCVLHASYLPAKLRWLSYNDPLLFAGVSRWCGIGENLTLRFFGKFTCSLSVASWTGLQNRHLMEWDKLLLAALNLSELQFPKININGNPLTELVDEWAKRWPALANVNWYLPIGDGVANNIGSGCLSPDRVALMMATSGAVRIIITGNLDAIPYGLWAYRIDQKQWLVGGALSSGGNVIDWLLHSLDIDSKTLDDQLAMGVPDSHGLTVLPFLAGERNPNWADSARGAIIGLSLSTTPLDIFRATIEAIAYQYSLIYEALQPFLPAEHKVYASGGAISHYTFLGQLLADVLGRPIYAFDDSETSSRGVAIFTLQNLHLVVDLAETTVSKSAKVYEPSYENHKLYKSGRERHRQLYDKLVEGPK